MTRRVLLAFAGVLLLGAVWELYKDLGPATGVKVGELAILPRTTDLAMPHLWTILDRLGQPVSSLPGSLPLVVAVLQACLVTLGIAGAGWGLGVVFGFLLALLMQAVSLAERAVLPFVILSQTVPVIALAPLVVGWGAQLPAWQEWMSVSLIAAYLAFCPIAVGVLRGLKSAEATQLELLHSYAAGWWSTLTRLRLPASVAYLLPALRLGASSAVVGAVVGEVSTGTEGGIGRAIVEYAQASGGDPAKPWAAILGAVAIGLVAVGVVALLGIALRRFRRWEVAA
ncbi:ABC transporter permease subunit [Gryllotalpicola sp.]|uniref:ABC transporter permease n=1 Tax=Gryllotalpicola sp. TaxID=1932787 RepID=UPI0026115818|nr:ABC transporter permease subunit [Gryllotalpicola sp.]